MGQGLCQDLRGSLDATDDAGQHVGPVLEFEIGKSGLEISSALLRLIVLLLLLRLALARRHRCKGKALQAVVVLLPLIRPTARPPFRLCHSPLLGLCLQAGPVQQLCLDLGLGPLLDTFVHDDPAAASVCWSHSHQHGDGTRPPLPRSLAPPSAPRRACDESRRRGSEGGGGSSTSRGRGRGRGSAGRGRAQSSGNSCSPPG
mmetsp:Transcript_95244/g.273063  ORF Transcript_95244/g.273063 Transcript_95244/m.273063 type:complete len:202 (-) Transcript_95244:188-793(-)